MRDPNRFNTFHLESGLTLKGCGGDRTRTISPQKIASLTNPMRFETFRERPEKTHEPSRNHEFHPTSCDISHQCMPAIGISAVDRPRAIDYILKTGSSRLHRAKPVRPFPRWPAEGARRPD